MYPPKKKLKTVKVKKRPKVQSDFKDKKTNGLGKDKNAYKLNTRNFKKKT